MFFFFFFNDTATTEIYTLSLHDALPILKDNTYYAELHIYRGDAVIQIDARPSDSIAVALRLKAPIFTSENLLGLTSVETGEGGEAGAGGAGGLAPGQTLGPDALKTYLQNLDPEDFGKFTP